MFNPDVLKKILFYGNENPHLAAKLFDEQLSKVTVSVEDYTGDYTGDSEIGKGFGELMGLLYYFATVLDNGSYFIPITNVSVNHVKKFIDSAGAIHCNIIDTDGAEPINQGKITLYPVTKGVWKDASYISYLVSSILPGNSVVSLNMPFSIVADGNRHRVIISFTVNKQEHTYPAEKNTVSLYNNDGSTLYTSLTGHEGDTITLPVDGDGQIDQEGKTLLGWAYTTGATTPDLVDEVMLSGADFNLYAVFKETEPEGE